LKREEQKRAGILKRQLLSVVNCNWLVGENHSSDRQMADKGKKDKATPAATPAAAAPFTMNTTGTFAVGAAPAGQGDLTTSAVTVSLPPLLLLIE
jgi:hypothetical protein